MLTGTSDNISPVFNSFSMLSGAIFKAVTGCMFDTTSLYHESPGTRQVNCYISKFLSDFLGTLLKYRLANFGALRYDLVFAL